MTEEIASQEIDFMEYGDTQINTIDMERGQRKDLIGEMPVGIAVVRVDHVRAEHLNIARNEKAVDRHAEGGRHVIRLVGGTAGGTGTIPVCSRMPSKCAGN